MNLLPDWPLLSAFLLASFALAITPGPGVLYIVTRSLTQGRRSGLASVGGVALGNMGNALAAAIGLAALFAVSALAFTVVKYAGAMYLVYLGIQTLRAKPLNEMAELKPISLQRIFRDGFFVALLNPKTTIFFAAFLPQFMRSDAPAHQGIWLGMIFVAIAAMTDTVYALMAGTVAPLLQRSRDASTVGRRIRGCAFIGLGIFTAFSGARGRTTP